MKESPARPEPRNRVEVLHQLRVLVDGRTIRLSDAGELLVARLAVEDRPRSRTSMASSLWPERCDRDAAACLRRALWQLNRDAPNLIHLDNKQIYLNSATGVDLADVRVLTEAVRQGRPLVSQHAVRLLEADLLPQWTDQWLEPYRESLRQTRLHTLEALARNDLEAGLPGDALLAAMSAVGIDPLRESARRIVIAAHLAEGNVAEALRDYLHFRELLWNELRLRPSRELQEMLPDNGHLIGRDERRGALRA